MNCLGYCTGWNIANAHYRSALFESKLCNSEMPILEEDETVNDVPGGNDMRPPTQFPPGGFNYNLQMNDPAGGLGGGAPTKKKNGIKHDHLTTSPHNSVCEIKIDLLIININC